ncbi:MAG TPA: hypothetical protein VMD77_02195 [Candidatus Baltobacteraceae bacterium]|nr:hypothetical protein [Verrucomicrobiae bacterium]HTX14077.1 hypothetical protein [Candidatus Baltobacteraceae bacterium]
MFEASRTLPGFEAFTGQDLAPWIVLAIVLLYFIAVTLVLHRSPGRTVGVTRYDPPDGISPAAAAYLVENGRAERAFAAAIVSLAAKKIIKIHESGDDCLLEKMREPDASVTPEEATVLASFFPSSLTSYSFNTVNSDGICKAFSDFQGALENSNAASLLSTHLWFWLFGAGYSTEALLMALLSIPHRENSPGLMAGVYVIIWILLGGFCFVAALRVWPVTVDKLISWLPGVDRPTRPFTVNDTTPIFLTATAGMGMMFLASLTSGEFAILLTAVLLVDVAFRHLLEAPTFKGRRVIAELNSFREFLSRVDSGRLNHENQPGRTP